MKEGIYLPTEYGGFMKEGIYVPTEYGGFMKEGICMYWVWRFYEGRKNVRTENEACEVPARAGHPHQEPSDSHPCVVDGETVYYHGDQVYY